jgi:diguanylate cyclase (GGDEF)-like protein
VLFSAATLILFLRLVGSQVKNLVVSPLSKLSKATSEIASGNYAVNPQIKLIPAAFSEIRSLITNFREMAQSIMAREKLLEHLATHDNLTDLPNRALFQKGIQEQIEEDGKTQQEFAVLFIDVDDFKSVNDAFGHTIGDQALEQIASMLLRIIGPEDLVGRVGGDEFAILLAGSSGVRNAHSIAEALLHQLNQPLQIAGHEIYLSASIGVSIFPQDGSNPDLLIQSADTAMYQTKREGKHGVKFYTGEMETLAQERHKLSTSLHHALEAQEFELLFQPIYDFQRHNIVGSEALLRWNSRQLGLVMPSQFIDLASDTGLILPIGEWVMASACAQNQAWAAQGLPDLTINVNIAERQIKFKDFRETVEQALQNSGMPPHLLRLELSENIFFQNLKMIERLMVDLKQMGVKLSLDDFGTGYTTLSCLTRIPFDEIKIDRSLSRNVTSEPRDAAIVRGIIRIGHDLGMQVVAEGIETRDQFHFYSDLGCDRMQGYLYSHPVSAAQYESLLKQKGAPGMVLRPAESLSVPSGRDQRG